MGFAEFSEEEQGNKSFVLNRHGNGPRVTAMRIRADLRPSAHPPFIYRSI
jgi:hypothetical protein